MLQLHHRNVSINIIIISMLRTQERPITEQTLINPLAFIQSLPASHTTLNRINHFRKQTTDIIHGYDKRLLVIVGPCSIHDTDAALEYAIQLKQLADQLNDVIFIIMRVYFEKPRTTIGWKGLIRDPHLDQSFDIQHGLILARRLLLAINELGLPTATEFLDAIVPHYLQDLITWGAIGARTVQSQMHRELASSLSMPIGFKNNTDGNITVAIDAVQTAKHAHQFISINQHGHPAIINSTGNPDCHIILRGSNQATNYSSEHIQFAINKLNDVNLTPRLLIDCSHGNSMKDYQKQAVVLDYLLPLLHESSSILGFMLESHLMAGSQQLIAKKMLRYGQSITDGCMGWDETANLLKKLASFKRS